MHICYSATLPEREFVIIVRVPDADIKKALSSTAELSDGTSTSPPSQPQHTTTMAKTALVTGATGLLGRQVVKSFQRAGWDVVGTGYTRAKPPTITKLDLGNEADISNFLQQTQYAPRPRHLQH